MVTCINNNLDNKKSSILFVISTILILNLNCFDGSKLSVNENFSDNSLAKVFQPAENLSGELLENSRLYADSIGSTSVVAIKNGKLIAEWGKSDKRISGHSIRKSLVSALYGIAESKGLININKTLAELSIDDKNPKLSNLEKQAKIFDLLTSRSGIYHPSIRDDGGDPPEPGSHKPGEFFFYNNWSFNALGGIFEKETNMKLGEAFKLWIADPIGMFDFRIEDVLYEHSKESVFPAYRFWITARDLALFGVLYLQNGMWNDKQIIPADWINKSTQKYSQVNKSFGYGFMWWITEEGGYLASGTGGQKLLVDPIKKLVVVNRVDTGKGIRRAIWWNFGKSVNNSQFFELAKMISDAIPN